MKIKFHQQLDAIDCGPTCLKIIFEYYGKIVNLDSLREKCYLHRMGVSMASISKAAIAFGCKTTLVKSTIQQLVEKAPLPAILHWNQEHFVVLHKISENKFEQKLFRKTKQFLFHIADPAHGNIKLDTTSFKQSWIGNTDTKGIALFVQPQAEFQNILTKSREAKSFRFLTNYIKPHYNSLLLLVGAMVLTTIISLLFPYLTQYLIDSGVTNKNYHVITLVLLAQFFLFIGETTIGLIRSWLLLHMNTRVSISIISDFLAKIIRLPIKFFDTKTMGDITQRITDHLRIESFLTSQILSTFFSIINIIIYLIILLTYNLKIFTIFFVLSTISILWVLIFMKKRRNLDYKRFQIIRHNQDNIYEIIMGMQEIKLNLAENKKRWGWEKIQIKLFGINIKSLNLEQYQRTGFVFFNTLKNILLTYFAATETVKGNMSLGMLLAISYIIGQTNSPLEQIISFIRSAQDAKISIDRLQEIHNKPDEDLLIDESLKINSTTQDSFLLHSDIHIENLTFQYEDPSSPKVLDNITLLIPKGKITAIVGASGSGKTTLMKILLKFYEPISGNIFIDDESLNNISSRFWRSGCGVVMQDGYIFADTIENNITLAAQTEIDNFALENALHCSNLNEFISSFPLGLKTKLGANGLGLSAGQKQRLLIARAVYKNPSFLLFDEATSALDANNEKIIVDRLNEFFKNKTVIVIAHRLSTVKNANQIIVLDKGKVIETGNHIELSQKKGYYYELVKNQLELGN